MAPFATAANRQREVMIADLVSGPLAGREWKLMHTDAATGERSTQTVGADAGEKLKAAVMAAGGGE